jgi:hypothetical protein
VTVALAATGGPTYASGATLNHTVTMPAGVVAGDLIVLLVAVKPDTSSITTPSGYTLQGTFSGGGGTTGIDTGPTKVAVFTREATGTDPAPTVNVTSTNVGWFTTHRITKTGSTWSVAAAGGTDATTGSAWSVTAGTDPGLTAGDLALVASVIPTDVGAGAQFTAEAVSATGVSAWSAFTEVTEANTNVGNDIAGFVFYGTVTTGSSTAAPVITATASGTTTNVRGPSVLLRIREAGGATQLGTGTLTLAPSLSGSGSTVDVATGSLSVTPTATGTGIYVQVASGTMTATPSLTGSGGKVQAGSAALTVTPVVLASAIAYRVLVGSGTLTLAPTFGGSASVVGGASASGTLTVTPALSGSGSRVAVTTATLSVVPTIVGTGQVQEYEAFAAGTLLVQPALTGAGKRYLTATGVPLTVVPDLTGEGIALPDGGIIMAAAQLADARAQWADANNIPDAVLGDLLESAWVACLEFLPAEVKGAPGFAPEAIPAYVQANVLHARETFGAFDREGDLVGFDAYAVRIRPLSGTVRSLLRPSTGRALVG